MIRLFYADAFFIFFLLWTVFIAVLWRREQRRIRRNEWRLINRQLFHCDKCHHSFVSQEPVSLCRCPNCNAMCIRRRGAE